VSACGATKKARDGRLPRALQSALPAWRSYLPPCWMLCFNCGAILVPRNAWCWHRSRRWYVPTNEEKTPCVDFVSSFQNFRHLTFQFDRLCNRIVSAIPGFWSHSHEKSTDFRIFSYGGPDLLTFAKESNASSQGPLFGHRRDFALAAGKGTVKYSGLQPDVPL
jgi:hypothetical protein